MVASFGSGQIGVYSVTSGKQGALVNAHARWINALDVAKDNGLVGIIFFNFLLFMILLFFVFFMFGNKMVLIWRQ